MNGVATSTAGADVSVDPMTSMLPVVPDRVHSGVPPASGAVIGHPLTGAALTEEVAMSVMADWLAAGVP